MMNIPPNSTKEFLKISVDVSEPTTDQIQECFDWWNEFKEHAPTMTKEYFYRQIMFFILMELSEVAKKKHRREQSEIPIERYIEEFLLLRLTAFIHLCPRLARD
jgi:hypothetical protein